jgi:hypothetical protein
MQISGWLMASERNALNESNSLSNQVSGTFQFVKCLVSVVATDNCSRTFDTKSAKSPKADGPTREAA